MATDDPRFPLRQSITTRDGTLAKDSALYNAYVDPEPGRYLVTKRPGTSIFALFAAGVGQAAFTLLGKVYVIIGDVVYTVSGAGAFAIPSITSSGLLYDVVHDITFGASTIAVLKSTAGMWVFDGSTITKVTNANYPAVTVRGLVLIDGTYYVMGSDGIIHGSVLEDPTTWTALNFVGTDQALGPGVVLFRHLNYAMAFCSSGTQGFYDNNNPAPGSPLSPASNASYKMGCASGDSVVTLDDKTIFLSQGGSRGRTVRMLAGLSMADLSTPFVEKILNRSNLSFVRALAFKLSGHNFYCLLLGDLGITLTFDLTVQEWYVWTGYNGSTESYWPYAFYVTDGLNDYLLHTTQGRVDLLSPTTYQDVSGPIQYRIRTLPYDGGTTKEKFFTALTLAGDTVATTISMRYSDDDYQTFSTFRTIDLSSTRKMLRSLGRSRRRSFEFLHTANTPVRLEAMEFDVNLGNS